MVGARNRSLGPSGRVRSRSGGSSCTAGGLPVTFATIGYGDQAGYHRTDATVRDEAHAHDARLRAAGAEMGIAGAPVQVRNHNGAGTAVANGPFMSAALP
jgi:hypothetical protein